MTLDSTTNRYILDNIDLVNSLGYDLITNGTIVNYGNATKKAQWFLKMLSNVVYDKIEKREEGQYLKTKFNENIYFVKDILIEQFLYWEDSDVDILQSHIKGLSPYVETELRNKGFLFEGKILR